MTDSSNQLTAKELPLGILKSNWAAIENAANQIADEVEIKSDGLSGNFNKQALAVSHFLRSKPDYHRALNQSIVLAIANPLAKLAANGELTQRDISKAVGVGLCTLSRHGTTHRSLFRIFLYPILLTYFVTFGTILVAHFIMPYFVELYAEFGIALPTLTSAFLNLSQVVRTYTVTILLISLGLPPLLWFVNWIGHEKRPPGMSRLDLLFSRRRPTAARWLLHFSLLLEAGLIKTEAIDRASTIAGKSWVRRQAGLWKTRSTGDYVNSQVRFFDRQKLRMADTAIDVPRSQGQIVLLQHVATWYRDSSSNIIQWWVQLLIPLYVLAIFLGSILLLTSLLSPFLAIISGLTGGGGPGGIM